MADSPTAPASLLDSFRELCRKTGFRPHLLALPAFFAFSASLCEGYSVALMVPAVRGIVTMDFLFLKDSRGFSFLYSRLPWLFPKSNTALFLLLLGLIFVSTLLKNLFSYASSLKSAQIGGRFSNQLRQALFNRGLSFGKLYYDQSNIGHTHTVLFTHSEAVANQMLGAQDALGWVFLLAVYIAMMFWISWELTLGVMLVYPILHYAQRRLVEKIKRGSQLHAESKRILSGYASNILSCILLIKSYGQEEAEKREFARISGVLRSQDFSIEKKVTLVRPIQETIFVITLVLLLGGIALLPGRHMLGPSLLVYFYLLRRSATAFSTASNFRASLAKLYGPVGDILGFLSDKGKFFVPDGTLEFPGLRREIELRDLRFSFPNGRRVIDGISLRVPKGKMTAIVGPSGTGKTTLINLVLRFYDPPPGAILIDGTDIREFTLKSLTRHMALVSQDTLLFNDTIRRNVAYGLDGAPEEKLWDALRKARLADFVSRLPEGLDTRIGDRGVRLSGGEKQRLSIARAMLKGAEILILDEATSSLDSQTETLIQESIEALLKEKTSIVIAHRLSTIRNADSIAVIESGRLAEQGGRQELLDRKGLFYRYWEEQRFA